jgi:pimeloyl-ACP methyl ester carboxylesterase
MLLFHSMCGLWQFRRTSLRSCLLFAFMASVYCHGQLTMHDCGEAGEPVRCGTLRVAENQSIPDGRHLDLSIVVVPRTGNKVKEPLFILKGGPGETATTDVEDTISLFRPVRAEHDLVLLDQRGTGATRLRCEVADRAFLVPLDPKSCLARLQARADLRFYTTEHFVDDLDAARAALGYEQISLWGASYGTRVAYEYARRHTARVRSLVLVAPAPLSMPLLDVFGEDGQAALDALAADCAVDSRCSKAFPAVRADVRRLHESLPGRFDRIGLQMLLYSSATARQIPFLASRAAAGDRAPFTSAIEQMRYQLVPRLSLGLHLAVLCSEDLPFHVTTASPQPDSFLKAEYDVACQGWPQAELPADFHTPIPVDKPALLITGEWDPATPPRWARVAADQFSRNQLVIVPKEGHMLARINECIGIMTRDFLERGNADPSCALRLKPLPYQLQ